MQVIDNKHKILEAAQDLFQKNGFDGTSISQIAKQAGVAKSLVFHHFPKKEALWKAVKANYVSHMSSDDFAFNPEPKSLSEFLTDIINKRFKAFEKNPELARLVLWQLLESKGAELTGIHEYRSDDWENQIKYLQKNKIIRPDFDPDLLCTMLYGAISQVFFDQHKKIYKNSKALQKYKKMLLVSLEKALTT